MLINNRNSVNVGRRPCYDGAKGKPTREETLMAQFSEHFTVRLAPEDVAAIRAIAAHEDRSSSNVARRLLRVALAITDRHPKAES